MSRSAINITGTNVEGTNLGTGTTIYTCASPANNLNFKSLVGAGNVSITSGATEITISGSSGGSAAGVDTSVQFNNNGAFSGTSNITWDEANTQLDVVGDIAISGTSFLRAGANDIGSIELGESTSAIGTDTISIGNNSYSNDNCSISLGYYAKSNGIGGITIGNDTEVSGDTSIAIGSGSAAKNDGGISIGVSAGGGTTTSFGIQSIFIGAHAGCNSALGTGAIGIGYKAIACTVDGVAIGRLAIATGSGTAVGRGATTNTGTVVGRLACTVSGAVALGYKSCALALRDVAIGDTATADGAFGTAIGFSAYASGLASMAIGCGADSTGATSIAFGSQAAAYGTGAIGIGTGAKSKGSNTVAIGTGAIEKTPVFRLTPLLLIVQQYAVSPLVEQQ